MKSFFAVLITLLLGASAFGQQSLGEIARQNRNKKKPSSVVKLSDDNMSRTIAPDTQDAKSGDDATAASADRDKNKSRRSGKGQERADPEGYRRAEERDC